MSKIIFYGVPAHGHMNPSLQLTEALVKSGEQVYFYSTEEFAEKIRNTGAVFMEYRAIRHIDLSQSGESLTLLFLTLIEATSAMIDTLLGEADEIRPDLVIHDAIAVWGRFVAAKRAIPAVCSVTTFAYSGKSMNPANTILFLHKAGIAGFIQICKVIYLQRKLKRERGFEPRAFIESMMNEEKLNIVYTSRHFQPSSEHYADDKYKFVGPLISPRKNDPDTTDYSRLKRPLIYISMGTVWSAHFNVAEIIDALAGFDATTVISGSDDSLPETLPANIIIRRHINQLEVLKYSDAFITHGGMNSVNEALYHRVPLILHPFQSEQDEVARRVVALGCGTLLKKLSKNEIQIKVAKILNDSSYRNNCAAVSDSFKAAGGSQRAIELIKGYLLHK